jgi:Transposase DDE domain
LAATTGPPARCNILMIVAKSDSIGIPLYWDLLDNKSGNSNSGNRITLLNKVIEILGKERIRLIVGDREFVGLSWIKYLKENGIPYCMRVPKGHLITLKNGDCYSIEELLSTSCERYFKDCMVDGVWGNCLLKRLPNDDYLFLMGNFPPKELGRIYRNRWCIETLFQAFKGRGFDLESTHLKCSKKLSKLLVFVSIAVAICVKLGTYYHEKVQTIKTKKHGYKANSFFRKGLTLVRRGMKNPTQEFVELWAGCIVTFIKWIDLQFTYNQRFAKIFG